MSLTITWSLLELLPSIVAVLLHQTVAESSGLSWLPLPRQVWAPPTLGDYLCPGWSAGKVTWWCDAPVGGADNKQWKCMLLSLFFCVLLRERERSGWRRLYMAYYSSNRWQFCVSQGSKSSSSAFYAGNQPAPVLNQPRTPLSGCRNVCSS